MVLTRDDPAINVRVANVQIGPSHLRTICELMQYEDDESDSMIIKLEGHTAETYDDLVEWAKKSGKNKLRNLLILSAKSHLAVRIHGEATWVQRTYKRPDAETYKAKDAIVAVLEPLGSKDPWDPFPRFWPFQAAEVLLFSTAVLALMLLPDFERDVLIIIGSAVVLEVVMGILIVREGIRRAREFRPITVTPPTALDYMERANNIASKALAVAAVSAFIAAIGLGLSRL